MRQTPSMRMLVGIPHSIGGETLAEALRCFDEHLPAAPVDVLATVAGDLRLDGSVADAYFLLGYRDLRVTHVLIPWLSVHHWGDALDGADRTYQVLYGASVVRTPMLRDEVLLLSEEGGCQRGAALIQFRASAAPVSVDVDVDSITMPWETLST